MVLVYIQHLHLLITILSIENIPALVVVIATAVAFTLPTPNGAVDIATFGVLDIHYHHYSIQSLEYILYLMDLIVHLQLQSVPLPIN